MAKTTKINDEISVIESSGKRNRIYIVDRGQKMLMSSEDFYPGFYHRFSYDDNYIVTYSYGSMSFPVPLSIKSAYSIKGHKKLDISNNQLCDLLEKMIVCRKGFDVDEVLTEINSNDLGLMEEEDKGRLHEYLTSGNEAIAHSDIVNYILSQYPELRGYSDLNPNLTVAEYRRIVDEIGKRFDFHAMSQEIEPEGTGLKLLYTSKKDNK